ncbi:MAG: universal stress protein [Phycisphaeraceae bacterium]
MKTILVPIDFSDVTPRVIDTAGELAKAWGARVHLLHTVPEMVNYASVGEVAYVPENVPSSDPFTDAASRYPKELKQAHDLAQTLQSQMIETKVTFLAGSPVDVILDLLDSEPIDMIVMGSHGHGRLYELIVGTVTESVLRRSNKPVLVVPSNEKVQHAHRKQWKEPMATPY